MKKLIFGFLISAAILFVLIAGLLFFTASRMISKDIIKPTVPPLNYNAWFSANQKINKEMIYLRKGKDLISERTLALTKEEMDSLLNVSISAKDTYGENEQENYNVEGITFSGKEFIIDISIKLKYKTPFGSFINLHFKVIPSIADDNLEIEVLKTKIGDMTIPSSIINYLIASSNDKIENNKTVKSLLETVKTFSIENDRLLIKYIPAEMLNFINN